MVELADEEKTNTVMRKMKYMRKKPNGISRNEKYNIFVKFYF